MSSSPSTAAKLAIPAHLRERQMQASDPATSIWVSANAGSGKTHVLAQRVIRLLLTGVPPAKILCLTFTKAAAAQMAQRVFETLSGWSTMEDGPLKAAILDTGAPDPRASDLTLARRLFTRTVETPGGLKIQTIHAFCERLLHLFPFEANVPARFEVADELRTAEMMALAKRTAVAAAQQAGNALGAQLALVADLAGSAGIDSLLGEAIARRGAARRTGHDQQDTLGERLGAGRYGSVAAVRSAMIEEGIVPGRWLTLADRLATGLKTDADHAALLRAAAAARAAGAIDLQVLDAYLPIFFTGKGEERKTLVTAATDKAAPGLKAELTAEQVRLGGLLEQLKIAEAIERTQALLALADAVHDRYEHAKITAGLLDFNDLIDRTLSLLERCDSGWVLHKLDAGIDHVLVDEAQDTSETQWRILEHLTGEFAVGAGARSAARSFFVVGDDKQSIFSFQGAAPLMFDTMRSSFERRFRFGEKSFARVALTTSFRSVPGILAAVDTVFGAGVNGDGLVRAPEPWPAHDSIKTVLPGLVEIWPRVAAAPQPEPADWAIPLDIPGEHDPASIVADRVAQKIRQLTATGSGEVVHEGRTDVPRPIRPGDILVLVRTRNAVFEAVIRALKRHGVPVAGADRLDIARHIAVMDLVAAGRTALLPSDDLSLASVLKSPLFGCSDDDLLELAPGRRGSLFEALAASPDARYRNAHTTIEGWTRRASAETPFAFFIELLGREGGRRLMEARLGPEAHDALDEFLRLALVHEQNGAPALGTFLDEIDALETSIKRDMEGPGDAVRVMTVHAAKGLEAKIVFLPDTCGVPAQRHDPVVFDLNKDTGLAPVLVWSPSKGDDPAAVEHARDAERLAAMREYRRLLYVALTRAEERLYVAGFFGVTAPPSDCWNAMITDALADSPEAEAVPAFWCAEDRVTRIATAGRSGTARAAKPAAAQGQLGLTPEWLRSKMAPLEPAAVPLRPSGSAVTRQEMVARRRVALEHGTALHLLLQTLPAVPPPARAAAGRSYLLARRATLTRVDVEAVLAEALAVIAHPDLAALFAPAARAEVAVRGRLQRAVGTVEDVAGSIDRIAVLPDHVLIADFKSGEPEDFVPDTYLRQLALYRRVLQSVWPGREIRALLIWTRRIRIVALEPAALDAAAEAILTGPAGLSPSAP